MRIGDTVRALLVGAGFFGSLSSSHAALIALYEFNGTTADSIRGAAGLGTVVGTTTFVAGRIGNGLSFNGSTYLTAPVVGSGLSTFSLSTWVKFNNSTTWGTLVKNWGESSPGAFHLGLDNASSKFSDYITSSGTTATAMDSSTITTGQWYHVVATFNGSANRHTLYVNGVSKASASASGTLLTLGSKMSMGAKLNDAQTGVAGLTPGYLNGVLDDVAFYNEELSSAQITSLYNNGLSGTGAVPEPSGSLLLAAGLAVLLLWRRAGPAGARAAAGSRRSA